MGLAGVGGIFPVDVYAVEPAVFDELDGCLGESLSSLGGAGHAGEAGGVGPTADGKKDLELTVVLLEEVELFDAAVAVGAGVVPGVVWGEVDVGVGPGVG